jgi:hypothetical protein
MASVDAMDYEYLMRRALQCGRSLTKGADADIYRRLEHAYGHFTREAEAKRLGQPSTWNKSLSELESDYKVSLRKVGQNVLQAISLVLRERVMPVEQQHELNECRNELPTQTLEKLDAIIERAQKAMIDAGITLA